MLAKLALSSIETYAQLKISSSEIFRKLIKLSVHGADPRHTNSGPMLVNAESQLDFMKSSKEWLLSQQHLGLSIVFKLNDFAGSFTN